jgi:cytochrome c biogenesis protein CcmG/thiol:disulfide interchange protein DsbE
LISIWSIKKFTVHYVLKGAKLLKLAIRHVLLPVCFFALTEAHAAVPFDLSEFRGQVVYLDFWASWCGPCRQSFPWMQTLQGAYSSQGLKVVAINVDTDRADAEKFLQLFHPSFDVRFDPAGDMAEHFKVKGMPTSVIIDRHGAVRYTHIGFRPVDRATYEDQLRRVLTEK